MLPSSTMVVIIFSIQTNQKIGKQLAFEACHYFTSAAQRITIYDKMCKLFFFYFFNSNFILPSFPTLPSHLIFFSYIRDQLFLLACQQTDRLPNRAYETTVYSLCLLTFNESVDLGQPSDDAVSAVPLTDVNLCRKQAVGWLGVDEGHTHTRLERQRHNTNVCFQGLKAHFSDQVHTNTAAEGCKTDKTTHTHIKCKCNLYFKGYNCVSDKDTYTFIKIASLQSS